MARSPDPPACAASGSTCGHLSTSVALASDEPAVGGPPLDDEVVRWRPYAGEHDIGYVNAELIRRLLCPSGELDRAS